MGKSTLNRAVFLDRDGVLNEVVMREGKPFSPRTPDEFSLVAGVGVEVARLRDAGFQTVLVTNQPDLGRGLMAQDAHDSMMARLRGSVCLDHVYVCPDDDHETSFDKKPNPGMLLRAAEDAGLDLGACFLIGDTWKDVEAARRAGCVAILLDRPYNREIDVDCRAADLRHAIDWILEQLQGEV